MSRELPELERELRALFRPAPDPELGRLLAELRAATRAARAARAARLAFALGEAFQAARGQA